MVGPGSYVTGQTLRKFGFYHDFTRAAFYLTHEMIKTLGFSNAKLYIILQQILH